MNTMTYRDLVPRKTEAKEAREPTALMRKLLNQLRALKERRGYTFEQIENRGGHGQQTWDKWENGASPKLETLETTAAALDAELMADVQDKRHPGVRLPHDLSPESVEIVAVVDAIPDERIRMRIALTVHRLAAALGPRLPDGTPPQLPPPRPTRRKPDK